MKSQITAVIFSLLLFSTLAHEYQRAQHISNEAKSHQLVSHFQNRVSNNDHVNQQCSWVCEPEPSNGTGLQILINELTNIIVIVNGTANVAIAVDLSVGIVAVLNGNTGAAVAININTKEGVYIKGGVSSKTWLAANISIEAWVKNLTSLNVLIDIGNSVGVTFNLHTVTKIVLQEIANILVHLSTELAISLRASITEALSTLIQIGVDLIGLLQGPLKGILKGIGFLIVTLSGDLYWLIGVLRGIAKLVGEIVGGLAHLLSLGVRLNLNILLAATNGLELFIGILGDIAQKVDPIKILGNLLSSVEKTLDIIVQLGGNINTGLTGVLKVLLQIYLYIYGHVTLEILVNTLINFSISAGKIEISVLTNLINRLLKLLQLNPQIQGLVKFLENLRDGKLIINGVDISNILKVLLKGVVTSSLDLVVNILLMLKGVVAATVAIPQLLLNLLQLLNTTVGIAIVIKIVPNIKINETAVINGEVNIIQDIIKNVNILDIVTHAFDINYVLTHIPIVSDIVSAISTAVNVNSNGSLNFSTLIKSSDALNIVSQILLWIKTSLNIPLGIPDGNTITSTQSSSNPGGFWTFSWGLGEKHHEKKNKLF